MFVDSLKVRFLELVLDPFSVENLFDLAIVGVVERTYLDTDRAPMIIVKIRKTAWVDNARNLPIFMMDGFGQDGLRRALADADLALGTEIFDPGVIILGAKG